MGRRKRNRIQTAEVTVGPPLSRIARVRVDEATWSDFKRAIGDRSVAEVLGRYVETEVARWNRDLAVREDVTERELVDALARAEVLTDTLSRITHRLTGRF
ncbi:hypothetical protein GKE82_04835 [Conexibacter sp. W3-3-2]|uniref:hypothetical protein n=1 Tax=Conexibacter sp. W3-3-2 TaxID=2675227 RepID=UPI0012B9064E|nr:hypothetical protein [Conexibacter sp. W3-3-2]MTD43647.1 hypothetical protein [Conexibacter sp. W3-3-2]